MTANVGRELYIHIEEALLERGFLKHIGLSKKAVLEALTKNNWKEIAKEIVTKEHITCQEVLDLSEKTLKGFSKSPKEGYLKHIFEYTGEILFPDHSKKQVLGKDEEYHIGRILFSQILKTVIAFRKKQGKVSLRQDIFFLTPKEIEGCITKNEYETLRKYFRDNYIDVFLYVSVEVTGFNTVGHIGGVHFVAMHIAKQLKKAGVPIDIACVSGAAITHDIGKFGCKTAEHSRIPYLHYYYTDEFLTRIRAPQIGHIASNHSTWDLELENLSVESLVLIYADFRTKSVKGKHGEEIINFYSLEEAFDVILNKLDNVDEAKRGRYVRVYKKLHDFEKYIKANGVSVKLGSNRVKSVKWKEPALLSKKETIERLKFLAIKHNIEVMSKFNSEVQFGNLLESARSEKDWKNIRAYINTLEEYFTYMTQKQKVMTIKFLFDLLVHREGDIRRKAAGLIGKIIANYDEEYRKDLPEGVESKHTRNTSLDIWRQHLNGVLYPDLKTTEEQKRWMGYTLKITLEALLQSNNKINGAPYIAKLKRLLGQRNLEESSIFILLDTVLEIPIDMCEDQGKTEITALALRVSGINNIEIKIGSLRAIKYMLEHIDPAVFSKNMRNKIINVTKFDKNETYISIVYLKYKIRMLMGIKDNDAQKIYDSIYKKQTHSSEIFRENLKVGTPWVIKVANIELLLDELRAGQRKEVFYVAMHFSNLLKVSERVTVRHSAGEGLVETFKLLTFDQRNEIVVELTKGLEIGDYQFSKYIPKYLGMLAMELYPDELNEFVGELGNLLDNSNERVASVTLDTLGEVLSRYDQYSGRQEEKKEEFFDRKQKIVGMILRGMANYRATVNQEAFMVLGQYVFGSKLLTLEEKFDVFKRLYKKMLTLISNKNEDHLTFFNNAAALNHIYRFIAEYEYKNEELKILENKKVAFFPGTFDPFSLSHKGIVTAIRDMGFEVYLAIDEFSWSKKTQPRMVRRQIISMSVADENNVYIFPDDRPVNIANENDIKKLKETMAGKEMYIVVGSDVVANASSYKLKAAKDSIHSLNHVIFKRESAEETGGAIDQGYKNSCEKIKGKVLELTLPTYLEDISSTRIRENIDSNRDISALIDPLTQNYIYEYSLYMREPQYKYLLSSKGLTFSGLTKEGKKGQRKNSIIDGATKKTIACAKTREVTTANLYEEFKNEELAAFVRRTALGKIVFIDSVYIDKKLPELDLYQLILTETLAEAIKEDFAYAIYKIQGECVNQKEMIDVLQRQGFREIELEGKGTGSYAVDMRNPVAIFQNMDTVLKEPFNKNRRILRVIDKSHKKMQHILTKLYAGSLVLSFSSSVMHQKLIEKITEENGVSSVQGKVRKLGPYMCVPFGKILRGMAIPNTVTKTLHTEKYFKPNIDGFAIEEYPLYASLEDQVETLKSFDRPVILVDDILHKGYRMKKLDYLINKNQVEVQKIIVGLLSGRGKDLMTVQGRKAESVYFVPNLEAWYVESSQYPFIGGEGIKRKEGVLDDTVTSINLILPYVMPPFLKDSDRNLIYEFSRVCLENARDIFLVLESEYQDLFQRNLTLQRLSEAVKSPKTPDVGECLQYDKSLSPSAYIISDLEKLTRLGGMVE